MNRLQLVSLVFASMLAVPAFAQDHAPIQVSPAVHHDTLPSLRNAVPQPDGYSRFHDRVEHDIPLPYVPPGQQDGAVQDSARSSVFAPNFQTGVDGVGNGFSGPQGSFTVQYAPPDTAGAIGATQYVQVVNVGLAVFNKADKSVAYGPVPTNTLWSGFGGQCETSNDGDAVVVYDKAANRWIVSQFAVSATPYLQCVAVSQTSDATGAYNRYSFAYGSIFPDYPKMGVWPDGYYTTFNMFNGNSFAGSQLCAYDRTAMLSGAAATQQCFQLSNSFGGVLPADVDGATAPPAGSPNYLLNFGANSLNLWKFHVDWATPANTTLSAPTNIPVAAFSAACNGGSCIAQPKIGHQKAAQLDSLADRLMFRLAYRNFGDHESLVVNHSVTAGSSTGVRWYEIRSPGATPLVYQQSTFAPDANYRWMGSIGMDRLGDIALGYSVSSSTLHPSVRYTGRLASDALSTMQAETSVFDGAGSQGNGLNRWGDYSAMTIDPVDDCTFWFTSEYLKADGTFNWSTRIGSFTFPSCGPPGPAASISFTTQPSTGTNITAGATIPLVAHVVDANNQSVQNESVTLAVATGPGTLSGTTTASTDAGGNATFSVSLAAVGSYTLTATDTTTAITPATSNQFNIVAGKAATITFAQAPSDAVAGAANAPAIVVNVVDGFNNPVLADNISLSIASGPSGATLSVTNPQPTDANGNATFADAILTTAGTYTLTATDSSATPLTATSTSFNITPDAPTLVFTLQPAPLNQGDALGTIAVTEQDQYGNLIADSSSVDFTITTSCGTFDLGSVNLSSSVATLTSSQRFYTVAASLQITATVSPTLTGTSKNFSVSANGDLLFSDGFDGCRL